MDNNDLMRRIRYAVQLDDAATARLATLGGAPTEIDEVAAWRAREDETAYRACPDAALAALLDGLVIERRGPPPPTRTAARRGEPPDRTAPGRIDNNRVLKQLKIALELRAGDVQSLVAAGGGRLGKSELGAFFRKPGTRNFRRCGDQVLRWFLTGLATRRED